MKQFFSIFLLSGMMICSVVGCDGNKPMSSLILGELQGNVKTCKISTYILYIGVDTLKQYSGKTIINYLPDGMESKCEVFDEQGNLVNSYQSNSYDIIRNEKQQIAEVLSMDKDDSGKPVMRTYWTYDEEGNPIVCERYSPNDKGISKFTYNNKGFREKFNTEIDNGKHLMFFGTYKYLRFDEKGNWTERLIEQKGEGQDNLPYIEEREIDYYDEK